MAIAMELVRTRGPLLFFCFDDFGVRGLLGKVRNSDIGERGFLVDLGTDPAEDALLDVSVGPGVEGLLVLQGVGTLEELSGLLCITW